MQSNYAEKMEPVVPAHAEPSSADPSAQLYEADFMSTRTELAAAFRKLGRGVHAKAAYALAKDFYKSGGHDWTLGLGE